MHLTEPQPERFYFLFHSLIEFANDRESNAARRVILPHASHSQSPSPLVELLQARKAAIKEAIPGTRTKAAVAETVSTHAPRDARPH